MYGLRGISTNALRGNARFYIVCSNFNPLSHGRVYERCDVDLMGLAGETESYRTMTQKRYDGVEVTGMRNPDFFSFLPLGFSLFSALPM